MGHKNVELVNNILNEVGHYIIATVGQHSLDWDYACYANSNNPIHPRGEFFLFHNKKTVSFKSSELVYVMHKLFEAYKVALNQNLENESVSIKYVIKYDDLKVDLKIETESSLSSALNSTSGSNLSPTSGSSLNSEVNSNTGSKINYKWDSQSAPNPLNPYEILIDEEF